LQNVADRASNMADVGRGGSDQWPKWQTALLVGTPVALGLAGLWYYTRRKPGDEKSKRDKPEKGEDSTTTEGTTSKVQSPSDNVKAQQKSTSRPDVDLVCKIFVNDLSIIIIYLIIQKMHDLKRISLSLMQSIFHLDSLSTLIRYLISLAQDR